MEKFSSRTRKGLPVNTTKHQLEIIGHNVRELREMRQLTQAKLAEVMKVSDRTISAWENGLNDMGAKTVSELAWILGVTPGLLHEENGYMRVDPVTLQIRDEYVARCHVGAVAEDSLAPLYGRIAAGKPIEAMPVEDSYWAPPKVLADHPHGFYLRVEGESMNRVLPNGCLAFVDPRAEVRSGDIAALNINGCDATIKRVLRGASSMILSPDSTDDSFTDVIFDRTKDDAEEVTLIGRVVWFVVPYEEKGVL